MRFNFFRASLIAITLAAVPFAAPMTASAGVAIGVSVSVGFAPPALPVYVQPPLPAPGYMWVPGYWAWAPTGYYWVPGTWLAPPVPGFLWTPGYWGWVNGAYLWHPGYWGPHVGFYGGVNYGFGYTGVGFAGGYWRGGAFFYNSAVLNVGGVHVNVFARPVPFVAVSHVSFNGGVGGIIASPTRAELIAAHERHVAFAPMQRQHIQLAARNPAFRAEVNGGRPAIAATARAGAFSGRGQFRAENRAENRAQFNAERPAPQHGEPHQHAERHAHDHGEHGHGEHPDHEHRG